METRLWLLRGTPPLKSNPIKRLLSIPDRTGGSPFDYETNLLTNHLDRIIDIFDGRVLPDKYRAPKVIPPLEVEFQPSEECTLNCNHCIGRFFKKFRTETPARYDAINLDSVLNFQSNKYSISRLRISGLLGDPLFPGSEEFSYSLIRRAHSAGKKTF